MHDLDNALAEITANRSQMARSMEFRGYDGGAGFRRRERRIGGLGGAVPDAAAADLAGASL
jgi:hypothetical protein